LVVVDPGSAVVLVEPGSVPVVMGVVSVGAVVGPVAGVSARADAPQLSWVAATTRTSAATATEVTRRLA